MDKYPNLKTFKPNKTPLMSRADWQHWKNYDGNRTPTLERDNYNCVHCGSGENLHVDHIKGVGKYDCDGGRRNELSNLQTLCNSCHMKKTWREQR